MDKQLVVVRKAYPADLSHYKRKSLIKGKDDAPTGNYREWIRC
jgi:hypothetical protein